MPKAGADRTNLVSSVDILQTILEILDVPAPAGLDGRSWLPRVRGEKQAGRDHVVTHVTTGPKITGTDETHPMLKTKDDAAVKNVVQWILAQ